MLAVTVHVTPSSLWCSGLSATFGFANSFKIDRLYYSNVPKLTGGWLVSMRSTTERKQDLRKESFLSIDSRKEGRTKAFGWHQKDF